MFNEIFPLIYFSSAIIVLLILDLVIFHKKNTVVSLKEAMVLSVFWISLALLFNLYIYYSHGSKAAIDFLTAYLIEKSLSVDNLFVFMLIFKYFHTPLTVMHKVLFYGILGAIVMRAIFIFFGIALISNFHWMIYVFGAILCITGIKLAFEKDKKIDPEKNPILRLFRYCFRVSKDYSGDSLFIIEKGVYYATPLFIVLLSLETTDIIFAIDSVPAVLAVTTNLYIVFTSNIFAILGLRSLFFLLSRMMSLFHHLHYGISFILVFVGLKMLISNFVNIENIISLGVVFLALVISIAASIYYPEKRQNSE